MDRCQSSLRRQQPGLGRIPHRRTQRQPHMRAGTSSRRYSARATTTPTMAALRDGARSPRDRTKWPPSQRPSAKTAATRATPGFPPPRPARPTWPSMMSRAAHWSRSANSSTRTSPAMDMKPGFVAGNSYANPRIPLDQTLVEDFANIEDFRMVDISYATNEALWDDYFFSTVGKDYVGQGPRRDRQVPPFRGLREWQPAIDQSPPSTTGPGGVTIPSKPFSATPEKNAARAMSARIMVEGAFNVNSTSKQAWKAVLASMAGLRNAGPLFRWILRFLANTGRHPLPPLRPCDGYRWLGGLRRPPRPFLLAGLPQSGCR